MGWEGGGKGWDMKTEKGMGDIELLGGGEEMKEGKIFGEWNTGLDPATPNLMQWKPRLLMAMMRGDSGRLFALKSKGAAAVKLVWSFCTGSHTVLAVYCIQFSMGIVKTRVAEKKVYMPLSAILSACGLSSSLKLVLQQCHVASLYIIHYQRLSCTCYSGHNISTAEGNSMHNSRTAAELKGRLTSIGASREDAVLKAGRS